MTNTRDKLLKIRITLAEQAQLAESAKSKGLAVSDYVRDILFVATTKSDSVATKSPAVQTVATKRIDTPAQAKEVVATLKPKLPCLDKITMSMREAKALRYSKVEGNT